MRKCKAVVLDVSINNESTMGVEKTTYIDKRMKLFCLHNCQSGKH